MSHHRPGDFELATRRRIGTVQRARGVWALGCCLMAISASLSGADAVAPAIAPASPGTVPVPADVPVPARVSGPALPDPLQLQEGPLPRPPLEGQPKIIGGPLPVEQLPPWGDLVEELFVSLLPDRYIDDRHWGKRSKRFHANHGFWQRHTVVLRRAAPDPGLPGQPPVPGRPLIEIVVRRIALSAPAIEPPLLPPPLEGSPEAAALTLPLAEAAEQPELVEMFAQARFRVTSDYAWWVYGVKGINGTVDADATIQLRVRCTIELRSEADALGLPRISLCSVVRDVDMKLTDLDVRRIGLVGGSAAQELGNGSRKVVEDILQSQEGKLRSRLQQAIDKRKETLSLSMADWFGK